MSDPRWDKSELLENQLRRKGKKHREHGSWRDEKKSSENPLSTLLASDFTILLNPNYINYFLEGDFYLNRYQSTMALNIFTRLPLRTFGASFAPLSTCRWNSTNADAISYLQSATRPTRGMSNF